MSDTWIGHFDPKSKNGRNKFVWTRETIKRLEDAFSLGLTMTQACEYAGVSPSTFFKYKDSIPALSDEKINSWRERPKILAKSVVNSGLIEGNHEFALKYLERVSPEEFSTKQISENKIVIQLDNSQIDKAKEIECLEANLKAIED